MGTSGATATMGTVALDARLARDAESDGATRDARLTRELLPSGAVASAAAAAAATCEPAEDAV